MLVYMPVFPPAKAALPAPPSLCKVSLGGELQTSERGCPEKSRILGLILVSGGRHVYQDQRQADAAMENATFAYLT